MARFIGRELSSILELRLLLTEENDSAGVITKGNTLPTWTIANSAYKVLGLLLRARTKLCIEAAERLLEVRLGLDDHHCLTSLYLLWLYNINFDL